MSNLNQVVMAEGWAGVRFQRWNQQDLLMGRMGGSREVRRVDPEVLGLIQLSPTGAGKKRHHGNWTSYTQASNFSMIFTNPPSPRKEAEAEVSFLPLHKENNTQDTQRDTAPCPRPHSQ